MNDTLIPTTPIPTTEPVAERDPLWLYLHFPLLALESQQLEKGIAGLLDERGQKLALCSYDAGQVGIEPGMAIATAFSICPEIELFHPNPERLQQQLESLALWAGNYSAQVVICPPEGLLLEIASMLHYFGGLQPLWNAMQASLRTLGFQVKYATGHTPQAARLLARAGRSLCIEGKQAHQQVLQLLPIQQLELPAKQQDQLRGMGLLRLEQLLDLPRDAISSRFGPKLLHYLDRISGQQPDPQTCFEPPPAFSQFHEFSREVESSLALLFPLRRMLASLAGYLRQRDLLALQLDLILVERDGRHQQHTLGHAAGAADAEIWLALCKLRLEQVKLDKPVLALQLEVERFKGQQQQSYDLFERRKQAEDPMDLLSRLRVRLGEQAVQPLALSADHRPELGWQGSWQGGSSKSARLKLQNVSLPQGRPGWLLHTPAAIAEQQLPPHIELLAGPERISSGWWDETQIRRDYYVGRWHDGRHGWLFRDARGGWFLHGWFG